MCIRDRYMGIVDPWKITHMIKSFSYNALLTKYPISTKMVSAGLLMAAGDITCQLIVEKRKKTYDAMRTIKLASIGGFVVAPALHFWYGPGLSFCVNRLVPRIIPGSKEFVSTRFGGAFVGMLIDQLTFSFLCNGGVIFGMEYLSRWDVKKAYDSMTSKLWETQLANWKVWPFALMFNFSMVPLQYRVLFANFIGFFWNTYLSWISNRGIPK
eukprot:TRINITY_DN2358_c0_g1_i2.p1 TRINITY_DN2358_c0_g1~~TRINITY_DN2358_c0_g1_i2.p1  ORF type:complete len:212 (+),score=29.53 TRINITY_DN2358_c0_g1_i2:75-710(+)